MTFLFQLHNKIKGFGLFEILISLVLFAVGVIAVTSLNAKTYKIIKNNELADFADRTMVKSLEYFKTPTTSDVQAQIEDWISLSTYPNLRANCYISPTSIVDDSGELEFTRLDDSSTLYDKCDSSIPPVYRLRTKVGSLYEGFNICEEVIVEKKTNGYKITSRVVYDIGTETKVNQLIGYRPFTYEGN